jgi:hypothetical protein
LNLEPVLRVVDLLNSTGVPYMIVGSFASIRYARPRYTGDADFVVEPGDFRLGPALRSLGADYRLVEQLSFETVTFTTKIEMEYVPARFRFEFFVLSDDPYDRERFARRREVDWEGRRAFVLALEDVIVTKLRWHRRKDRQDVQDVIAVSGGRVDWDYVHRWCDLHGTRKLLDEIRAEIPPL